MKANIKLSLSALTFVNLLALIRHVIASLTGNPNFATPLVPLADMTTLADKLENSIEVATDGSRLDKKERNALVLEAQNMLRAQANYVRAICNGDEVMLLSSGFDLSKQPVHFGVPVAPKKLTCRATDLHEQVEVRWPSVDGAHGYRVFKTDKDPATNPEWEYLDFTTRVSFIAAGLESYKPYWFSVTSLGTAGESNLSTPAMGRAA